MALCQITACSTYRVASLHLIDRHLGGGESGVPSTVTKLYEKPLVGRATKVTLAEVTAIRSSRQLLFLKHTHTQRVGIY